jgi:hypothetical protein
MRAETREGKTDELGVWYLGGIENDSDSQRVHSTGVLAFWIRDGTWTSATVDIGF